MYEFAVIALLGLATLGVTNLATELVPSLVRFRTATAFLVAMAGVAVLDHSMFSAFGITVSNEVTAVVVTGLVVGSLAATWRSVLSWFDRSDSVTTTATRRTDRPRVAA